MPACPRTPLEQGHLTLHVLREQTPLDEAREAERALRHAKAAALHAPTDSAEERSGVVEPVVARPELMPVDHRPVAGERAHGHGGEHGEVGERGPIPESEPVTIATGTA